MKKPLEIIIDTDIGDDIDDLFALLLAVNSPELHVRGITTVFRNARRRAQICSAVFETCGVGNIPVCAGCDVPFIEPIHKRDNDLYDEKGVFIPCQFMDEMERYEVGPEHAVDYLIRQFRQSPGEVTLVAIGPLTNVAMAIRKAPDIAGKIAKITLMGGAFYGSEVAEWNILCDPEAARIVFDSGTPIQAVGLNVTMKCKLPLSLVEQFRRTQSKLSGLTYEMVNKWLSHFKFDCPVLHDPLTVGTLVDPTFVQFEKKHVEIVVCGEKRGFSVFIDSGRHPVEVAREVESERYLRFFTKRVFQIG